VQSDKYDKLRFRLGLHLSTFDTINHHAHQRHRAALAPFFARQRILNYSPEIQVRADTLADILLSEYAGKGKIANMNEAFGAYTADAITWYAMAHPFDYLRYPDFVAPYTSAIVKLAKSVHAAVHFPWILPLVQALPHSLVRKINPPMGDILDFQKDVRKQVSKVVSGENSGNKNVSHRTVFHELLNSDSKGTDFSLELLEHEALGLLGGGIETTKNTLSVATYHVLANPSIHARLRAELEEAIPDPNAPISLLAIEKLPYLNAVIQEGLRLSYGIPQRSPRINNIDAVHYKGYAIPPGTPVGMSTYLQLRHPDVFPNPDVFDPERWTPVADADGVLQPAKAPNGNLVSKYQVTFSKGARMCVGMNLAMAEIQIGFATLFRRVDGMRLFETDRKDVDMAAEYLSGHPVEESKGVRVIID